MDVTANEVLAGLVKQRSAPVNQFYYLTKTLVLREAVQHPTKGWKTKQVKNLQKSLKGLKFDFHDLIAKLQKRYDTTIFSEDNTPIGDIG